MCWFMFKHLILYLLSLPSNLTTDVSVSVLCSCFTFSVCFLLQLCHIVKIFTQLLHISVLILDGLLNIVFT
uniref:Uncharacterized protein n=1 Tax=Arundo donax TaxID=35708 RepID=A0A0A9F952_ARUDO